MQYEDAKAECLRSTMNSLHYAVQEGDTEIHAMRIPVNVGFRSKMSPIDYPWTFLNEVKMLIITKTTKETLTWKAGTVSSLSGR